ncbi:MAG: hypothetical protein AAFN12_06115 [Cyanobacteria bacterium J06560_2]
MMITKLKRAAKHVAKYVPGLLVGSMLGAISMYALSQFPILLEANWSKEERHFIIDSRSTANTCIARLADET